MSRSAPSPRRRRRLFAALLLAIVWLAGEAAGAAAWSWLAGEPFTFARAAAARAAAGAAADAAAAPVGLAAQQAVQHEGVLHPFLGFVYDPALNQREPPPRFAISPHGFVDTAPPLRRRGPDRYVVGVVGGSVSLQMCLYAEPVLVAELQRLPRLQGRRIEVVRLGLGGYKQPQGLFAVLLALQLGGEFDAVVLLDGFNDVALPPDNQQSGVAGWYPRGWAQLAAAAPSVDRLKRIGALAVRQDERRAAAAAAGGLWWSPLAQFVWLWRDRRAAAALQQAAVALEAEAPRTAFAATGPAPQDATAPVAAMVEVWQRGSELLAGVCKSEGIEFFHFLQPNQYVPGSKPIGADEAAIAVRADHPWRRAVENGYPLLRAAVVALRGRGVRCHDLVEVFADHPEPLYADDCCHLGERGYGLLAAAIGAAMRRDLEFGDDPLEPRRLPTAALHLDSPLRTGRVAVLGRARDGTEHDVGAAAFGTGFESVPPDALEVGASGAILARRRGEHRLRVRSGAFTGEVAVTADWPDQVVADDGVSAPDGRRPQLAVAPPGRGVVATVRCSGLPQKGFRLLGCSSRPLPAALPQDRMAALGLLTLPLDPAAAEPAVEVPLPAPGTPLFLRAVVVGEDGQLLAASNQLVLTR